MQHAAQTSESDINLESEINNVPKVGNSSTPSSPRSKPCSPPCTPPETPPDRFADSFQYLSDSSASGDEDLSEVESFIIDADDLNEESKARLSSKLLLPPPEDGGERTVDPETQARLQSLLKAAGINKFTAGDGKQLADPEVLRRLTSSVSCALDEAAAALTRMRSDSRQANKRALIKACTQGNVTAVRKLLKQGISVNETSDEGESLLSLACSAGYYELAQVLLAMHASVEDRGSKGDCTPLMEAASAGYVDIVRLLLAHGAEVNAQSSTGNTPLMYACAGGHVQTVRVLLDSGANVEEHNENGHTPLMEAASAGHVDVAKMLLKHGAGINTHSNEFKESALTLACYKGHLEMVNFLLKAGADQEHKTDEMHTALMEASMDGHVEVAKLLLDSGAQVNMPTDSFESPLTLAACGGHVELAVLLIERGANIEEVNDEGYTPLMEAAREGHEDMVSVLLQRGARINAQTEETQETALTLACCGGFVEVADFLLKNGADIELGASTPLMEASQEGHLDLVKYLLESGANVHAHTQTADTALTYACENGHTDVADILVQAGANLEHESEGGRTPLMKACRAGHLCTVQFLVQKNADINRKTTSNDHTPLSLACAGGHLAIVQFLLDRGANLFHKLKDNSTMLIEAAKGGHTSVVEMLLDYPARLNSSNNVDNNLNVTAPTTTTVPTTTATATQTCSVPTASASPETPKMLAPASRSNAVVASFSAVSCAPSESQNNKMSNNTVRQIATALPKTSVRKLCRDPRLTDPRGADMFPNGDASKNIKMKRTPTLQPLQQEPFQTPQSGQPVQENSEVVAEQQQQQQQQCTLQDQPVDLQQKEKPIRGYLLKKAMESKKIKTELQRVEQVIKEGGLNASDIMEISKELEATSIGTSSSTEPLFSNNQTSVNNQTITTSAAMTTPPSNSSTASASITETANLNPTPPTLIPVSEVLQSTAISDRPKAKPTKKEGKILRKQHLLVQQPQTQPLDLTQPHSQPEQQSPPQPVPSSSATAKPATQDEQSVHSAGCPVALQQQTQARHLKQLAEINAQLQQQVIKNQKHIEMQKQHQQLLQQQQMQHNEGQQPPQLIGSGTITVATNAPNLADIFSHQDLLAQIQQMDSNFAKTFPDFAEKTIEKEMRVMQQMISCDSIQQSLQRCHFLSSISEDEASTEDVTNNALNVEEKRLCDVHQSTTPMLIDATIKGGEKFSPDKHNFSIAVNSPTTGDVDLRTDLDLRNLATLNMDQPNWVPFLTTTPLCSNVQQIHDQTQPSLAPSQTQQETAIKSLPQPMQKQPPTFAELTQSSPTPSSSGQSAAKLKQQQRPNLKQMLPATQMQIHNMNQHQQQLLQQQQQQQQSQLQQQPTTQQKPKGGVPLPTHKQFMQQKQQMHQQQQIQTKFQNQKPQPSGTNANDQLTMNTQARQELHRHLNEMKAMAHSATTQQNQNNVTKCVADSTVSHAVTSTQTNVTTIKKNVSFDDAAGTLSKLAIGKKVRTVNPRVPPSSAAHSKDDGSNAARVPSTSATYNQNFSMDVDSETESNHDTALTLACAGGHEELVELLLSRGADIEHRDKKGFTPLILAATAGHEKVVDLLLNHNADIEAQSERTKDTPLSLACSGGRYEVVDLLLGRAANKEHRNVSDYTPLSLAASGGYVNIIKLLLSHGAEINSRTGSKLGISPLMLAAMNGHTAAVKLLLDMGSDINAQIETNRNTALTLACFQGRHEVVALLLERKANVEHRAKTGLTPLMEAASGGYVEVGRVLLEKGADVNAPPVPSSRDTALTIASDKGHVRFVELLIMKNALVEVKNKKGNSPMWLAANGGHLQVVELLYKNRADIDSQDNRKVSCLMAAFRKGHVKTVTWMVDRVNQFPSDQEMTRYITTVNDKELLDKCQACLKIIRMAKDEQAEKANEYATILLEELDMEKNKEEIKKAAALKRKERKKNKKLQKILEKRKLQEGENPEEDADEQKNEDEDAEEEYQQPALPSLPTLSKDKKESKGVTKRNVVENVNRRNNIDIEEGDSGIDANSLGSCSSNEVKVSSVDRLKDKKNSKKPPLPAPVEEDKLTASVIRESRSVEKSSVKKKKKKEPEKEAVVKEEKLTSTAKDAKQQSSKPSVKSKTPNEVAAKPSTSAKKVSHEDITGGKSSLQMEDKKKSNKKDSASESSLTKSAFVDDDDFEPVTTDHKKKKHNHDESTVIASSSGSATVAKTATGGNAKSLANSKLSTARRGDDEWKEVTRKCVSPTYRIKKVSVPLSAISRVIGRAGCNINAIRSTTGAHIEIEKQSKGQGERMISIKGSNEATKQAQEYIALLIEDPEMDIQQILPKTSKSPSSTAAWEKTATNTKSKTTVAPSNISSLKTAAVTQQVVASTTTNTIPSVTKTTSASATSTSIVSSATFIATPRTTSLGMIRPGALKVSTATFTLDKKPNPLIITTNVTTNSSASMPSSTTKTTMSYTSAIMMSTGKAPPKSAVPTSSISTTTVVSQTFAAKVSETTTPAPGAVKENTKTEPIVKPPIAPPPPTSNSIFIRPPPTASAPPTLPTTPNKQSFSLQQQTQQQQQQPPPQQTSSGLIVSQPLTLSAQISQQLSHPPPPLPVTITSSSGGGGALPSSSTKMTDSPMASLQPPLPPEEPSPVSTASEYSLFNDNFSKAKQAMWCRDSDESGSQKGMNFASVVTASGSPNSAVGNAPNHSTYIDMEPPVQVDASKAPGYRGNSMCSPNLQKPSSRSSASANLTALTPSCSLSFSNATSTLPDVAAPVVTAPIARPTSVPSSMDNGLGGFSPRTLFPDKTAANLFACDQGQTTVSSGSTADDMMMRMKVVSRLNPRAPDFRVPVKQSAVSISANQLPPTHQPPPMYNQQSLTTTNYLNTQQHPPTMMPNSNVMSYSVGKYGQQNAASIADVGQSQWSLMNAAAAAAAVAQQQHSNFSQNDLMNFVTPTTLNNLMQAQGADIMAGLENGGLANNANLMAAVAAASLRPEEQRKVPPKPIGTERHWTRSERSMPMELDHSNWIIDQKQQSWNQQMYRNNNSSAVTAVQTASAAPSNTPPYSCMQQVPEDGRVPMMENVYQQNDHYNGIVQNTVLQTALPPLMQHMNIGQMNTGPMMQSYPDVAAYPDTFKIESTWDGNRLSGSDIALPIEKTHHQQQPTQTPGWPLSWHH